MAVQSLGSITFLRQRLYDGVNFPPTLPYRIEAFFNDVTNEIVFTANTIPVPFSFFPTPLFLVDGGIIYATSIDKRYKYCKFDNSLVSFFASRNSGTRSDGTPFQTIVGNYWRAFTQPNHHSCQVLVCDLKFNGEPAIIQPTAPFAGDGQITVNSSSSIAGTMYAINAIPESAPDSIAGLTFQSSNVFGSLFQGSYRIYAKDNAGCLASTNVTLKAKEEDYTNTRLFFEFDDNHGQLYRVNIVERDNSGITTEVKAGVPPIEISWAVNDNIFRRIVGSILTINLKNTVNFQFLELLDKEDKFYRADVIKDPDGTPLILWSGFLINEQYLEDFKDPPYISTIILNDGLGELKHIDYKNSAGETITGLISRFETLLTVLRKIGINFNVRISVDLLSETEIFDPDTETVLHIDYLDQEAYKDKNCEEVLEDILFRFNARIHVKDGFFWVQRIVDNVRPFDYLEYQLDGTFVVKANINNYKIIQRPETNLNKDFYVESFPILRRQEGVKNVTLTRPSHARDNILVNGDFESKSTEISGSLATIEIEGWTAFVQGSTSTNINTFNSLEENKNDFVLRVEGNEKGSRVFSKEYDMTTFKNDRIKFSFSYFLGFNEKMPAVKVKWQVKFGGKYLTNSGDWVDFPMINIITKKEYQTWETFSVDAESFDQLGVGTSGVLTVSLWMADYFIDLESTRFFQLATDYEKALENYELEYRRWQTVLEDEGFLVSGPPPPTPVEPITETGYIGTAGFPDEYIFIVSYDYKITGVIPGTSIPAISNVPEYSFWEIAVLTIDSSSQTSSQEIRYWKNIGKLPPEKAGIPRITDLGGGIVITNYKDPYIDYNDAVLTVFPRGEELKSEFVTTKENPKKFFPEYTESFLTGTLPDFATLAASTNPIFSPRDRWIFDFHAKNANGDPIHRFRRSTESGFRVMEELICSEILDTYRNNYLILDASIFSKGVINFTHAIVDLINPVTDLGSDLFEGKIYLLGGMEWDVKRAVYAVTLIEMGVAQVQKNVTPGTGNVDGENSRVIPPDAKSFAAFTIGFSKGFNSP